jgi:23S rRNA pseudouridine2604 synthase
MVTATCGAAGAFQAVDEARGLAYDAMKLAELAYDARFARHEAACGRHDGSAARPSEPPPLIGAQRRHHGREAASSFMRRALRYARAMTFSQRPRPTAGADFPRLSKRMGELGLASRREADEWIAAGYVRVNGVVVDELGSRVDPQATIEIDERARQAQGQRVTVLLHKPVGYVSGQAEDGYTPAIALVEPANRWEHDHARIEFSRAHLRHLAPAGRLDIDSTGLLVLTQDGRIARQLVGEDSRVEKEYLVRVTWPEADREGSLNKVFPAERLALLRHGLALDGVTLKPAQVSWQNEDQLRFALREGRKRQIRRMCEAVGLRVVGLKRIRIGRIVLGDLPAGNWRYLREEESFR